jgi:hypothetical protein
MEINRRSFDRKIDYLERTIKYLENPHNEFNPERYYKGSLTLKPIAAELNCSDADHRIYEDKEAFKRLSKSFIESMRKHIIYELKEHLATAEELKVVYGVYSQHNNNGSTTENT